MNKKKETTAKTKDAAPARENKAPAQKNKAPSVKAKSDIETKDLIVQEYIERLQLMLDTFNSEMDIETNLTGTERRRLVSARVRNNGFIDKAFDVAKDNPAFLPPHFETVFLAWKMSKFQDLRQLMALADAFLRSVTDAFIVQADVCFKDASRIYASLREQTRANVPGARSLFELLEIYFKRRPRAPGAPTEKQLERDVKKLLKGKADGEIIIKNEAPKTTGGVHEVIDKTRSGKTLALKTAEESGKE